MLCFLSSGYLSKLVVRCVEPLRAFPSGPDSCLLPPVCFNDRPATVLATLDPFAVVLAPILPFEHSLPMLQIVQILPLVDAPIRPIEFSLPVHFVVKPLSDILPSIGPMILTVPFDPVVDDRASVPRPILPGKVTLAGLQTVPIAALELDPIVPLLESLPILLVVAEVPGICRP
jgi:hypothetical protein